MYIRMRLINLVPVFCTANLPAGNPGANRWFLWSTPAQIPPGSGGICGRLT